MILACIAVRLKSSRCPRKALADLYHRPLLERLIQRLWEAELVDDMIVCTSTNPEDDPLEEIATDCAVSTLRGHEEDVADRFLTAANWYNAEHIIRVTGDNPLTDPGLIDDMIRYHLEKGSDYTYCRDVPKGTKGEIIKVSALEDLYNRDDIDPNGSEYMTYQLMLMNNKHEYKTGLNRDDIRLTVDYPEDLARVQDIYNHFQGEPPLIEGLIDYCDKVN